VNRFGDNVVFLVTRYIELGMLNVGEALDTLKRGVNRERWVRG
jgi:hypothetical protein